MTFSEGKISGYIVDVFPNWIYSIHIYNRILISHEFLLKSKMNDYPTYLRSSLVKEYNVVVGEYVENKFLFIPIGKDYIITVSPELPKGLYINELTGALYGTPSEVLSDRLYSFVIRNLNGSTSVSVYFKYIAEYCERDSGFSRTLALSSGNTVFINCKGSTGTKSRICYLKNGIAKWSDITNDCRISNLSIALIFASIPLGILILIVLVFAIIKYGNCRTTNKIMDTYTIYKSNSDIGSI